MDQIIFGVAISDIKNTRPQPQFDKYNPSKVEGKVDIAHFE